MYYRTSEANSVLLILNLLKSCDFADILDKLHTLQVEEGFEVIELIIRMWTQRSGFYCEQTLGWLLI